MDSPQWKKFQPSAQDSATPSYQRSPSFNKTSNNDCLDESNSSSPNGTSSLRETGIVEKLLHSYGFIQCCERQARLFFHYSQYSGHIEHVKLGDAVEFEMTYDRRTGKPIASSVCKITPEVGEVLSEERVSGFITTEIKDNTEGRVAYESRGECFFLPYTYEDIDGNLDLRPQDKVTFRIATDKNSGDLRARNIRLEKPLPERFQGVICALKETFGFIERADVVKEIFFHLSECKSFRNLNLGDDVEFSLHIRNNKEVAVNVTTLPLGTVVFEDIDSETVVGEIVKPLEKDRSRSSDTLSGKIRCTIDNKELEYPFGERDPKGEYTLQMGDWVQFSLATDRRDNLQRATNIELVIDNLTFSNEKREQGIVTAIKDTFGFITYGNRDSRLYFRLSELLNPDEFVKLQDEVEFTVAQDSSSAGRYQAIRIKILPPGTVDMSGYAPVNGSPKANDDYMSDAESYHTGVVDKAATRWNSSPNKANRNSKEDARCKEENNVDEGTEGVILYSANGGKEAAYYTHHDCQGRMMPRAGDKVEFQLVSKDDKMYATHLRILSKTRNGFRYTHYGYIAALKDSFGFIETEEHDKEVFFHYSVYDGNASNLEVGQEVEYGMTHKGSKLSAECVRKLSAGTIAKEEVLPDTLNGVILNPVRCFNPDQEHYQGKIRLASDDTSEEDQPEYEFGITSLVDKHEFLQPGDVVQFQIGVSKKGKERAVNIKAMRTTIQATVDTIKGNFGFLNYEAEEGKKLFFHMSEVKDEANLQPGDRVEFVVVHHQRTGKYSACSVVKIGESQPMQRPERLNRLRTISSEGSGGPRIFLVRQPKGPDGTNGFNLLRNSTQQIEEEPDLDTETAAADDGSPFYNEAVAILASEVNSVSLVNSSVVCSEE